jgi:hypothetical protein
MKIIKKAIAITATSILAAAGGYFLAFWMPSDSFGIYEADGCIPPDTPVWVYSEAEQHTENFLLHHYPKATIDIDIFPGTGYSMTLSGNIPNEFLQEVKQRFRTELFKNLKKARPDANIPCDLLPEPDRLTTSLCNTNPLKLIPTDHTVGRKTASLTTNWHGVYTSPSEIGGFSGTVLAILCERNGTISCRRTFYSDIIDTTEIPQEEQSGNCLTEGDQLYVPEATGNYEKGKPILRAGLTRYTRMLVNGHPVLMRDDALKVFKGTDKLYDYGILIKADDYADSFMNLSATPHESIRKLYRDQTGSWNDPFVNGPNKR